VSFYAITERSKTNLVTDSRTHAVVRKHEHQLIFLVIWNIILGRPGIMSAQPRNGEVFMSIARYRSKRVEKIIPSGNHNGIPRNLKSNATTIEKISPESRGENQLERTDMSGYSMQSGPLRKYIVACPSRYAASIRDTIRLHVNRSANNARNAGAELIDPI
jgi:hypothetical protein